MSIDRDQAIRENIIHAEDHARNRLKIDGLYGRVADEQNRLIAAHCTGQRVLDVGAGYGNLTRALLDAGRDCVGIEVDEEKIQAARAWYHVDLQLRDIHQSGFAEGEFDTVVFREVIRHLRLTEALREAARIASKRLIIFQANTIWPLRAANWLAHHREHVEYRIGPLFAAIKQAGFAPVVLRFGDPLGFPLSGGYVGPQLVPRYPWLYGTILALDRAVGGLANKLGLGPYLCFRFLLVADKESR